MFQLIISSKEQLYLLPNSYFRVQKEQGGNCFYYWLQKFSKEQFKKFSFYKVLTTYPEVKTFLPLVPKLQKREYKIFWRNLLPKQLLENKKIYLQVFPINDRQIRFAYYDFSNARKKNVPLFSFSRPIVSYFLDKFLAPPPNKNTAIYFDNEVLIIQKYFSDIQYFPNLQNLPIRQFFQAVEEFSHIEIYDSYFFLTQKIKISNQKKQYFSPEFHFFAPVAADFFLQKKIFLLQIKDKKLEKNNHFIFLLITSLIIIFLWSVFFISQTYLKIENSKKNINELRKLQLDERQIQKQQLLFKKGIKVFHYKALQGLFGDVFLPKNIIKTLEKLPLQGAWLLSFQNDTTKTTIKIAALNANFWLKNKEKWEQVFQKNISLLKSVEQDEIYYFFLEIGK